MTRIWAGIFAAWALTACSNRDALPFRSMKLTMLTTTQGAADTTVELVSPGKVPTNDPTLACTLEGEQSALGSRSIRCDREGMSVTSSFQCPITGTKVGASGGALTIGNTKSHGVHQFIADCAYGEK